MWEQAINQDIHQQLEIFLDVIIATGLAGIAGIEREISGKPAGLRTHMIIGGVSALLISLGKVEIIYFKAIPEVSDVLRTDPIRIMQSIIAGISFIGAGTILKMQSQKRVQYLTTAAALLFASGVGMSVALKQYILAIAVTLLVLLINVSANSVDKRIKKSQKKKGNK